MLAWDWDVHGSRGLQWVYAYAYAVPCAMVGQQERKAGEKEKLRLRPGLKRKSETVRDGTRCDG